MFALGIILGLGSALFASIAYLATRQFMAGAGRSLMSLLAMAHAMQAVVCIALLPLLWPAGMPEISAWIWPVLGTAVFYLTGQGLLFVALRDVEASRVAPLLGLKIVVVAALATVILHESVPPLGWVAVAMTVGAAMLLNRIGGRLPWRALAGVIGASVGYSLSDTHIGLSIAAMTPAVAPVRAGLMTVCLAYVVCGTIAASALPWVGRRDGRTWAAAMPYAAAWLASMFLLFSCFAAVGVVYGGMLQATRAVMSVALGWAIAKLGHEHLEQRLPRGVFYRRLAAAVLMFAAIALFGYARRS